MPTIKRVSKLTCDKCHEPLGVIWDDGTFCQKVQCFNCYIATKPNVITATKQLKNMGTI